MRKDIGMILMENEEGGISVHLYDKQKGAKEAFEEMAGKPGDPPIRATLVSIDYQNNAVSAEAKNLPNLKLDEHDGWLIGKGPINFDEEEQDETGS